MNRSRLRLCGLGLCLALLGVVVFSINSVQAEPGAKWSLVTKEGKLINVSETLLPVVKMSGIVGDMTLLSKIAGIKFELLCLGAEFINAKLELEGKVGGGNKVRFTECTTKLNGSTSAACKPKTEGEPSGTLLSTALKGLLVLYELAGGTKDTVIRFDPVTGSTFLALKFSEECNIGENCTINGFSSVRDAENALGVEQITHTVEQFAPLSELWVISKTPEHVATVDGQGMLSLSGEHAGMKWSGTAG